MFRQFDRTRFVRSSQDSRTSSGSSAANSEKKKSSEEEFKMEKTTGEYGDNQFWSKPTNDFDLDELMADMDWISVFCVCSRCAKNKEQLTLIHMLASESLRSVSFPWLRKPATAKQSNLAVLWALSTSPLRIRKFVMHGFQFKQRRWWLVFPLYLYTYFVWSSIQKYNQSVF